MAKVPALLIAMTLTAVAGCSRPATSLEQLAQARTIASDLLVQFTKAADAGNRAVMADTDEASVAFARESGDATQAVEKNIEVLAPLLRNLQYSTESGLLTEFADRFASYRALDQDILGMAVENTNLKAQRLSFGSAQQSADAFRDALETLKRATSSQDQWRAEALAAEALSAVRRIQVLQAPHIAEADDAEMTRMEKEMAESEAAARLSVQTLLSLAPPAVRPRLTAATEALDRFMGVNAEIVTLSRRNTNVRSLALTLGQKRGLTARCEETLLTLQAALLKRGFTATR
ncbi:MAG: hypothetical protein ABL986_01655 [Vicinamibacterales bacterium]